jgi:hypothetical protein
MLRERRLRRRAPRVQGEAQAEIQRKVTIFVAWAGSRPAKYAR